MEVTRTDNFIDDARRVLERGGSMADELRQLVNGKTTNARIDGDWLPLLDLKHKECFPGSTITDPQGMIQDLAAMVMQKQTPVQDAPQSEPAQECPHRKALEPFDRLLDGLRDDCPDSMVCPSHGVRLVDDKPESVAITYGDLRRARKALATPCSCAGLRERINNLEKRLKTSMECIDGWAWVREKLEKSCSDLLPKPKRLDDLSGTKYEVMGWMHVVCSNAVAGYRTYLGIAVEQQKRADEAEKERDRLREENERLKQQAMERENLEASICPEDVGFEEFIDSLRSQLAAAQEDRERLDWLSKQLIAISSHGTDGQPPRSWIVDFYEREEDGIDNHDLRAAIDAARAEKTGAEPKEKA